MSEGESKLPEAFTGALGVVDVPVLRAYIEDISRWLIREAVGEQVPREQCDALAEEVAVVLAAGLTPSLTAEIVSNTGKVIAESQGDPVRFDALGEMTVGGLTVPDVVRLIDAVGQLVDLGVGEPMQLLHESHRRSLYDAHEVWSQDTT